MVNSFYDPVTEEGCAFEELISFHGGMGGPQTQPFILHPVGLRAPSEPIVGAVAVNRVLRAWRRACNDQAPAALQAAPGAGTTAHSDARPLVASGGGEETRPDD
jgi:hypothetical protein